MDKEDRDSEFFTLIDKESESQEQELDYHYEVLSFQLEVGHIPESTRYKMIKQN